MLAPSAFLASAASTFQLQQSILPDSISALEDQSVESAEILWASLANSHKPTVDEQHIQKAYDMLRPTTESLNCLMWTKQDFSQHLLLTLVTGSMRHRSLLLY